MGGPRSGRGIPRERRGNKGGKVQVARAGGTSTLGATEIMKEGRKGWA